MNSVDEDAIEVLGINPKTWKEFRKMTNPKYVQDDLPGFLDAEAEARESSIDRDTFIRRKQALAQRWFGYYKKCKTQKKLRLIDQYNKIATMRQR